MVKRALCATTILAVLSPPISAQVFNQFAKLLPGDGAAFDRFGRPVAIAGDVVAVGARFDDDNGANSGSAYLFDADSASPTFGQQLAKLLPSDGAAEDYFGVSIAIAGGIAAVGAYGDGDWGTNSGSVYLFDADPASPTFGQQIAKLLPSDGARGAFFGVSIAVTGSVAAIGAHRDGDNGVDSGSAYLFDVDRASPTFGQQLSKLLPSDGAPGDFFGWPIAIAGGIASVGATDDDDNGMGSGSAYLFDADPASPTFGQQLAKLLPSDGAAADTFGLSIAISGGVAAVGAGYDNDFGQYSGSAYLFDADPASPTFGKQLAKLLPSDGAAFDYFGRSIAISGGVAAVGANGDDDHGSNSGSAYFFDADPVSPTFGEKLAKLIPTDGEAGDIFGYSIAFDGGVAAVGADGDGDHSDRSGSVYLFNLYPCSPADLNHDGLLNLNDVEQFIAVFLEADLIADCDGSGVLNVDDVQCFAAAFLAGCP